MVQPLDHGRSITSSVNHAIMSDNVAYFRQHMYAVSFMISEDKERISHMDLAASRGQLLIVQQFKMAGWPWNMNTLVLAVQSRNFELVKYCLEGGISRTGSLPTNWVVQFNGVTTRSTTPHMNSAAEIGDIAILQILQKYNFPWSNQTTQRAAGCKEG